MKKWLSDYKFVLIMLAGIILGTGYVNLSVRMGWHTWDVFSSDFLASYADVTVNSMLLWQYVLRTRVKDFLLLSVLGITALCRPTLIAYLLYIGACMGALISSAVMHFGMTGLVIYLVSVLPQYIFYGTALYFLYKILYKRTARLTQVGIVLSIALAVLLVGTYTEAYMNPLLLKKLYVYLY